jgi:hypothetical protein
MPNRDTPPKLVEAWLDFHREGLCRDLDTVFSFDGHEMEIWCRGAENREYRKLLKILEPLRNSHGVELYFTRLPKNDSANSKFTWTVIPPSIAENLELRSSLRPVVSGGPPRIVTVVDSEGQEYTRVIPGSSAAENTAYAARIMQSRLTVWANSVLRNSRTMRQYAADITELMRTAFEPAFGAILRRRASDICRKHAKDLVKSIRDLNKNLSRAFPKPSTKAVKNKKEPEKRLPEVSFAVTERADRIAAEAGVLSGRIYRFIYPSQHTVDLDELKRPGLLVSLDALEAETRDFEQALTKLHVS